MSKEDFYKIIEFVFKTYNKQFDNISFDVYYKAISIYDDDTIKTAIRNMLTTRESPYMPTAAEVAIYCSLNQPIEYFKKEDVKPNKESFNKFKEKFKG